MKSKHFIAALILCFCSTSLAAPAFFTVTRVHDGDTVVLSTGEQVRYLGVDAPEIGRKGTESDFMALESLDYNRRLVGKARVRLEFDEERRDRHGRTLAYVFLESGDMANLLLVRKGLASVLAKKPNLKYFSLLLECQRQAMMERIGVWSKPPDRPEPRYPGNRNSYRFHRPGCSLGKRIARSNLVMFDTREKAYWDGFSPCRRCKP